MGNKIPLSKRAAGKILMQSPNSPLIFLKIAEGRNIRNRVHFFWTGFNRPVERSTATVRPFYLVARSSGAIAISSGTTTGALYNLAIAATEYASRCWAS